MKQQAAAGRQAQALRTRRERERFARLGGITAHLAGRAHEWTKESAKEAGRKGGLASGARRHAQLEAERGERADRDERPDRDD